MKGIWANHLAEAIALVRRELVAVPGMIESQEYLLSRGRISGIGPKVMKQAASKLGIVFERHVCPETGQTELTGNFRHNDPSLGFFPLGLLRDDPERPGVSFSSTPLSQVANSPNRNPRAIIKESRYTSLRRAPFRASVSCAI